MFTFSGFLSRKKAPGPELSHKPAVETGGAGEITKTASGLLANFFTGAPRKATQVSERHRWHVSPLLSRAPTRSHPLLPASGDWVYLALQRDRLRTRRLRRRGVRPAPSRRREALFTELISAEHQPARRGERNGGAEATEETANEEGDERGETRRLGSPSNGVISDAGGVDKVGRGFKTGARVKVGRFVPSVRSRVSTKT